VERTSEPPFDRDAVDRPLSERGRVPAGPSPASLVGPAAQIEQSKERFARDIVRARAELRGAGSRARRRVRTVAVAAGALLAAALVVKAVRASRRAHRRPWRRALRAL
jgi:hypothetical protein